MGAAFHRGTSKQDYETDPDFIREVRTRFGALDFDLAATKKNAQAPHFFGPGSSLTEDALACSWSHLAGNLWLNPPYDAIATWAKKCSAYQGEGRILFLVPASVGANWFAELVYPFAHTLILNGRLTFVGEKHPFPKDCMLAIYGKLRPLNMPREVIDLWRWKADASRARAKR